MVLAALDRLNFLGCVFSSDATILILTTAQLQRGGIADGRQAINICSG
jgi:hypothetical protein